MKKNLMLIVLIATMAGSWCGADTAGTDTAVVIPFYHAESGVSRIYTEQAAWLLQKKLGFWDTLKMIERSTVLETADDENQTEFPDIADAGAFVSALDMKKPPRWIVLCEVSEIGVDTAREIEGPWFLGMAKIPVKATIRVTLYDSIRKRVAWTQEGVAMDAIPRLRFMGGYRNPLPKTPRSIDALFHPAILEISGRLLAFLKASPDSA